MELKSEGSSENMSRLDSSVMALCTTKDHFRSLDEMQIQPEPCILQKHRSLVDKRVIKEAVVSESRILCRLYHWSVVQPILSGRSQSSGPEDTYSPNWNGATEYSEPSLRSQSSFKLISDPQAHHTHLTRPEFLIGCGNRLLIEMWLHSISPL